MINSHQFKMAAKKFRAGRISLTEFESAVLGHQELRKSNEEPKLPPSHDAEPAVAQISDGNVGSSGKEASDGVEQPSAPRARVGFSLSAASPPTAKQSFTESAPDIGVVSAVEPGVGGDLDSLLARLIQRKPDTHKGDFGRVLAIGGSQGMPGAITLTGMSALRCGSGLVKLAVPEMIQAIVAANNPCLMTIGCADEGDSFHGASESSLSHHCEWADVVAMGPGMGRGSAQQWIVQKLYAEIPQPMIVDADGLNALADAKVDLGPHAGQRILTPHPGEFCRLLQQQVTSRQELEQQAVALAAKSNLIVVLKGHHTLVTDGQRTYRNQTGNAGMATAGSGDVLTGVITSMVGQGFGCFDAAMLGVFVHGLAGDLAAQEIGQTSLIATDIIGYLPRAMMFKTT